MLSNFKNDWARETAPQPGMVLEVIRLVGGINTNRH